MDDDLTRKSPNRPPAAPAAEDRTVVGNAKAPGQPPPLKPFASSELGDLLEGAELGNYRLEEFVGGGGMGAVFRATDLLLHRPAAVKVISGRHTDQDAIKRFQVEARSAARLDHQNLARVYNVGEDRGWHYIVFEYIDGVNLRDLVAHKGPLPQAEVVGYVLQVAAALDHASSRDVVHRDIKPSNVLVLPDGTVKVVDMGLARFNQMEANEDLTESGMTLGSFDYISPEQAKDPRNADVRSDLYSLGCTMFHMVTGQPPFPAGTALQKLLRHSSERPPDPRILRPDLDSGLVAILMKLLAKQPSQRFQNPRQLIAALLKVAPRVGMKAESGLYVTARPGWAERYLPWALPLGLCAALLGVMLTMDGAENDLPLPPGEFVRVQPGGDPASRPATPEETAPRAEAPPDSSSPAASPSGGSLPPAADRETQGDRPPTPAEAPPPFEAVSPGEAAPLTPPPSEPSVATREDAARNLAVEDSAASLSPANAGSAGGGAGGRSSPAGVAGLGSEASAAAAEGQSPPTQAPPGNAFSNPLSLAPGTPLRAAPAADDREDTRELAAPPVTLILVGNRPAATREDAIYVADLREAVEELGDNPDVDTIELATNGLLPCDPLSLNLQRDLTIRAAAGYSPTLLFAPQTPTWASRRRMITVKGAALVLSELHLVLMLPEKLADDWSMFRLYAGSGLTVDSCTITLAPATDASRQDASFVEIVRNTALGMGMGMRTPGEPGGMLPDSISPVVVTCRRSVLRGPATVLHCPVAESFRLVLQQSFVATTRRLMEADATTVQEEWGAVMRVELDRTMAVVRQGLARWSIAAGEEVQAAAVEVEAVRSIVATDVGTPILEHHGPQAAERLLGDGLRFRDENSAYPRAEVRLRISGDPDLPDRDIRFSQRDEPWYAGTGVSRFLRWQSPPPPDLPIHLHQPADYSLAAFNAAQGALGPDLPFLPQPPDLPGRPATGP